MVFVLTLIKLTSCNTKHEIKNDEIPQSLVATPQIRIRKLCAKVIHCSK